MIGECLQRGTRRRVKVCRTNGQKTKCSMESSAELQKEQTFELVAPARVDIRLAVGQAFKTSLIKTIKVAGLTLLCAR